MPDQEGLPERIGKAANELDIDFGRLTAAGWGVGVTSFTAGGFLSWAAYSAIPARGDGRGPALVLGLTMLAVTVGVFLALRRFLSRFGVALVKPSGPEAGQSAGPGRSRDP